MKLCTLKLNYRQPIENEDKIMTMNQGYRGEKRTFISLFTKQKKEKKTPHPKCDPFATLSNGVPRPSAVVVNIVFPHQLCIVSSPIFPLSGYCKMKNINTAETATPASRAADRT